MPDNETMDSDLITFLESNFRKTSGPVPRKDLNRILSFYRITKPGGRKIINMLKDKGIVTQKRNGIIFNFQKGSREE